MSRLENRMVVDTEWHPFVECDAKTAEIGCTEPGYTDPTTGTFVPQEVAFEYALQQCLHGIEKEEFKQMLEEWYFSSWVKER